jgi:hypothetical protein
MLRELSGFTTESEVGPTSAPETISSAPESNGQEDRMFQSTIAVMRGIESQEDWTPAAAAFIGMGISFLIWWWYFDGAGGGSEQPVRTRAPGGLMEDVSLN